ncbi:MAG: DUF885 family protein [Pirellulaceae bacterium]
MKHTIYFPHILSVVFAAALLASQNGVRAAEPTAILPGVPPKNIKLLDKIDIVPASELRGLIELYQADLGSVERTYPVRMSIARHDRMREFYSQWLSLVGKTSFDGLSQDGKIDYLLLKNYLEHELRDLEIVAKRREEVGPVVPFANAIVELEESRRRMDPLDAAKAAETLAMLKKQVDLSSKVLAAAIESGSKSSSANSSLPSKVTAGRAAAALDNLRGTLKDWNTFYSDYDPLFTWWNADPYKQVDKALYEYATQLREKVVGIKSGDETTIVGDPIGREALLSELSYEMIPYTPEELISLAEKEFAWCEVELKKASKDMGFGDDWKKALEKVKQDHVQPGQQPALIKELAQEAIDFLEARDLVTIPPLAKETWRMEMMPRERQLVNPFFTGGEVITVSFPTSGMTHEQKQMTLRGNNRHFSRATVQHELIPGHHLQGFMGDRYRTYRQLFRTPFIVEGWPLYWEMLLWDLEFPKSPENRVGMLFWRSHRCARIIFSLNFHLGKMTPQECVDFLVERVGHERENAAGEVRRSFKGDYGPLYQAGYMLGGLQLRALHQDLVKNGKMTNRQFHDAILKENFAPVELIRASLTKQPLTKEFKSTWKFYGDKP